MQSHFPFSIKCDELLVLDRRPFFFFFILFSPTFGTSYMSTTPAGFVQSDVKIQLFLNQSSRKPQFCHNAEEHRWCVGQTLGMRFKDFFP